MQRTGARMRMPNGAVSTVILVFFLAHAALGVAWRLGFASSTMVWAVWMGIALIGVHVLLTVATSYSMLTDEHRPPSAKKRQHLWLKWITGGIVVAGAAVHIVVTNQIGGGSAAGMQPLIIMLVLLAALGMHACTGVKSLLKDMGWNRAWLVPLRIAIIAVCCAIGVVALF